MQKFCLSDEGQKRIKELTENYFKHKPAVCVERALAYTKTFQETEGESIFIRRAKAFKNICETKSIFIQDNELIVGCPGFKPRTGIFCPEIAWQWLADEIDTISSRPQDPYILTEEQKELLKEIIFPYWKGKSVHEHWVAQIPDETKKLSMQTGIIDVEIKTQSGPGEFSPGYENIILPKGFNGIREEAQNHLNCLSLTKPEDFEKINFLKAVIICCDAISTLAKRYGELAEWMAKKERNPRRKKELKEIAEICFWVPGNPPRTFHEALQAIWFTQMGLFLEANAPSYSPGRFDQFMLPYYQNDIKNPTLTCEKAMELIECFYIKMSEAVWLLSENASRYFAGYIPFQNICVGGITPDGKDATNELSYMTIDAKIDCRLYQPSLSVRLHKKSPEEFFYKVAKLVSIGTGFPAIHNDETAIKMLLAKGIPLKDARNYCLVGCVEPNVSGKLSQWSDGGHYNFGSAVEFALNDGASTITGEQLGLPTGDPRKFRNFEDLMDAVRKQTAYFIKHNAIANLLTEKLHAQFLPTPFASMTLEGCVEKGMDMTAGGALYNSGPALILTGTADMANSLAAVKKLVFEEKKITMSELCEALQKNFDGYERLKAMLINEAPKYGNDDEYVDSWAVEMTDFAAEGCEKYKSIKGCAFISGLYPVSSHVPHGMVVGALPSGRKAAMPLADGCSPSQGTDVKGPTAAIKSVTKLNHESHTAGTLLNMKFDPAEFSR